MTTLDFLSCEICDKCGSVEHNDTINSRVFTPGRRQRRRKCRSCGDRWSTIEIKIQMLPTWREAARSRGERDAMLILELHQIGVLVAQLMKPTERGGELHQIGVLIADLKDRVERGGDVLHIPHIAGEGST